MKKVLLAVRAAILSTTFVSGLAMAAVVVPGDNGVTPDDFATISGTQGELLRSTSFTGVTGTFSATMRSAVYRNTFGTLDFYYQVSRLGAGTGGDDLIKTLTASNFGGFSTDVYRSASDPDGAGQFLETSGTVRPLTTVGRTPDGKVVTVSFALPGQAGIGDNDTTSTYIFRTDATRFDTGFWSLQDGSSISGTAFAPGAVPEPASWAMMIGGFGMIGAAMRRRQKLVAHVA
ncbi:PEPxxWA-CTERM sorting domain-containing protein [uncultured Sphingomonas sp.]|uniref:PEPxxWA-CTERM sorting domain-containing protein n=1 Tax=uncultured Sphingomonas sp. TaxID=158754 RepID=UPI0025F141F8|nr:PEPxxWA-CTERM sorting domain-containing protein [uncultured Sphingomonas sp.]